MLTAACVSTPPVSTGAGLSGRYVVNGTDPLGTEYSGLVTIDERSSGEVTFEWVVTGAILRGSGRRTGDTVSVTWSTVESPRGDSTGTAEYRLTDDGHLVGTRTVDGVDGVGREEIFPDP